MLLFDYNVEIVLNSSCLCLLCSFIKVVTRALQRQRGGRGGGEGGGGRGEGGGGRGRGGGGGGVKKVAEHIRFSDSDNET